MEHTRQPRRRWPTPTTPLRLTAALLVGLLAAPLLAQDGGDPRATGTLASKLQSADPAEQRAAAAALHEMDAWMAWLAIEQLPVSGVRDAALLDAILRVLSDSSRADCQRSAAAMTLPCLGGATGGEDAKAVLLRLLADSDCPLPVRATVAGSLAAIFGDDTGVVQALTQLVTSDGDGTLSATPMTMAAGQVAARVLAGLGPRGEAALVDVIVTGSPGSAWIARDSLFASGDPARRPLIETLFRVLPATGRGSASIRQTVVNAVLGEGSVRTAAINTIVAGLAAADLDDRLVCVRAVGELAPDTRAAIGGLLALLRTEPDAFRLPVLASLAAFGPLATSATPALEKMLETMPGYQQVPVAAALAAIDPTSTAATTVLTPFDAGAMEGAGNDWRARWADLARAEAESALAAHGSVELARLAAGLSVLGRMADAHMVEGIAVVMRTLGPEAIVGLAEACPLESSGPMERHEFGQLLAQLVEQARNQELTSPPTPAGEDSRAAFLEHALALTEPSFAQLPLATALLREAPRNATGFAAILAPACSGSGAADTFGWYAASEQLAASIARDALQSSETHRSVSELIAALEDARPETRMAALTELAALGPAAAQAVPAIQATIPHGGSDLARRMLQVLERVDPPPTDATARILSLLTRRVAPLEMRSMLDDIPEENLPAEAKAQLTAIVDAYAGDPRAGKTWSDDVESIVTTPPVARATLREVRPPATLSAPDLIAALERGELGPLETLVALMEKGARGQALVLGMLRGLVDRRPTGSAGPTGGGPGAGGNEPAATADVDRRVVGLLLTLMAAEGRGNDRARVGDRCPATLGALRLVGAPPDGPLAHLRALAEEREPRARGLALQAMAEIAPTDARTTEALLELLTATAPDRIGVGLEVAAGTRVTSSNREVCRAVVAILDGRRLDGDQFDAAVRALEPAGPTAGAAAPRLFEALRRIACAPPAAVGPQAREIATIQSCLRSIEGR